LRFDDRMFLMDDQVMLNRATVRKRGIRLGEVTPAFRKTRKQGSQKGGSCRDWLGDGCGCLRPCRRVRGRRTAPEPAPSGQPRRGQT
jgi:hypothetical protein